MKKTVAIPVDVLERANPAELAMYGDQPLTEEEIAVIEADAAAAQAAALAGLPNFLTFLRRQAVNNGFTHSSGIRIYTDAESVATLTALRVLAKEDPDYTVKYKANGAFFDLDAPTIIAIADEAREYVQSCFEAEAEVLANIQNGSLTTSEEVFAAFNTAIN